MGTINVVVINEGGGVGVEERPAETRLQAAMAAGLGRELEMLIPGTPYCMSIDDEEDDNLQDINAIATNFHNTYIRPDGDYPVSRQALICKVSNPDAKPWNFFPESLTDEDITTIYDMIENSRDSMWRVKKAHHLDEMGMRIHEKKLKENKS